MWMIGKANDEEIKEMEANGFEVRSMDEACLNAGLNGQGNTNPYHFHNKPEIDEDDTNLDKLVAIYIDCDIAEECNLLFLKQYERIQ